MGIETDIAAWDGKATDPIAAVYARHHADETFVADVIALFSDPAAAVAWDRRCSAIGRGCRRMTPSIDGASPG